MPDVFIQNIKVAKRLHVEPYHVGHVNFTAVNYVEGLRSVKSSQVNGLQTNGVI